MGVFFLLDVDVFFMWCGILPLPLYATSLSHKLHLSFVFSSLRQSVGLLARFVTKNGCNSDPPPPPRVARGSRPPLYTLLDASCCISVCRSRRSLHVLCPTNKCTLTKQLDVVACLWSACRVPPQTAPAQVVA